MKKPKYKRLSSEDFKAICDILFEDPNRPKVFYQNRKPTNRIN